SSRTELAAAFTVTGSDSAAGSATDAWDVGGASPWTSLQSHDGVIVATITPVVTNDCAIAAAYSAGSLGSIPEPSDPYSPPTGLLARLTRLSDGDTPRIVPRLCEVEGDSEMAGPPTGLIGGLGSSAIGPTSAPPAGRPIGPNGTPDVGVLPPVDGVGV